MSVWRLITRSLGYYWRTNLAVAAGVAVAVAVLVGSLLVGDSVGGSLRDLALGRLGPVVHALRRDRFFRQTLADDVAKAAEVSPRVGWCTPAIILDASAKNPETGAVVANVTVIAQQGVSREEAEYVFADAPEELENLLWGREAQVNAWLADDLGVQRGDAILISVGRKGAAPMESVFGRTKREDTVTTRRVVVKKVIPSGWPGCFTLRADRPRPRNLYVSLEWLQEQLGEPGRVNSLFVSGAPEALADLEKQLDDALAAKMTLADYDLLLETNADGRSLTLKSTRLVLPPAVVRAVQDPFEVRNVRVPPGAPDFPPIVPRGAAPDCRLNATRYSVYLANSIAPADPAKRKNVLPYSLIAGIDNRGDGVLREFEMSDGTRRELVLSEGDIVLNEWSAADLGVKAGEDVVAAFYVAGPRGELETRTARFKVAGVVRMTGNALDRGTVPEFEGITDSENMSDWNPPFPIDLKSIRTKDEDYWDRFRTTPKAFVSLETIRGLWLAGRPAALAESAPWLTALRLTRQDASGGPPDAERFARVLLKRLSPKDAGLAFRSVRKEALDAATSPTDFATLFLSMSFFLVASAAGLIWLLLRLTVDQRAGEIGILLASGFTQRSAARILVGEAMLVALAGLVLGIPLGVAYAWGIIAALTSNWSGAVAEFPLRLYVTPFAVSVGAVSGLAVAAGAIVLSSRVLRRLSAVVLLGGWRSIAAAPTRRSVRRAAGLIGVAALALALVLLVLWGAFGALPAAAAFASSGALLLVGLLALFSLLLQRRTRTTSAEPRLSLARLALRGASRHWVRSLLTAGLLAAASLLIVTVAAFRKDPARLHPGPRTSGSGGFNLLARSDLPIWADLNTDDGRRKLGFTAETSKRMTDARVYPFRQSEGADVSCLNLQRPKSPRVLGVPPEMMRRGGFAFSAHAPGAAAADGGAWTLLQAPMADGTVPAFADADTAQWQLKVGLGDAVKVPTPDGGEATLRIVGLLPGSVFAGELLVSEENFTRLFGGDSGYRFFLVECAPGTEDDVKRTLRATLGELGLDVQRTSDVLAAYADVQNTYLSAFETLGGLGLVLATFGIVTVLLRSVIERRSELAMMLAVGFRRRRVTAMVLLENAMLLGVGVSIGAAGALVAAAPQLVSTVADVRWLSLAGTLGATLAVGLASCAIAAHASLAGELVGSLRSE